MCTLTADYLQAALLKAPTILPTINGSPHLVVLADNMPMGRNWVPRLGRHILHRQLHAKAVGGECHSSAKV